MRRTKLLLRTEITANKTNKQKWKLFQFWRSYLHRRAPKSGGIRLMEIAHATLSSKLSYKIMIIMIVVRYFGNWNAGYTYERV